MKKLIAILMVLAIVAGFAFADTAPRTGTAETHKITVYTSIALDLPIFSFRTASANTNSTVKFDGSESTPVDFTATDNTDISGDLSENSITQTFEIYSVDSANYKGSFLFEVNATEFTQITDAYGNDVAEANAYVTTGARTYSYTANSALVAADNRVVASDTTSSITATYSGRTDGTNKIGQIVVTWPKEEKTVPGRYTADVTLTVTAQ